jgi:hypothetical protein
LLIGKTNAYQYTGERIIYLISPLGVSEYNDLGIVIFRGKKARLATFRTQVLGFDDTERIYTDPDSFLPLRVERDISAWLKKEYIIEEYEPKKGVLTIKKFKDKRKIEEQVLRENGPFYNAVLLPFYLRNIANLDIGWTFQVRVPKKFEVKLVSIEDIVVPAGKFKAYHFTSIPNKFEIWISKDIRRVPLKIKGMGGLNYTLAMKEHNLKQKQ